MYSGWGVKHATGSETITMTMGMMDVARLTACAAGALQVLALGRGENQEDPDASRSCRLLRIGGTRKTQRPEVGGQRKKGECETVSGHRITSSARSRIDSGIVSPRARAALRFTTSTYWLDCSIGKLAGWAPLRILSTYSAARRQGVTNLGPARSARPRQRSREARR